MKDKANIPPGDYCYRIHPIREGEKLSTDRAEFGKSLREYSYMPGFKQVLCPYWQRTDYGTVKCLFLNTEVYDEESSGEQTFALLAAKIGEAAAQNFPRNWALADEIKICGINEDKDDQWTGDA